MTPGSAAQSAPGADDDACWREAARLRSEFRGWIVIWLAGESQFRAYRRLPGARRDTALSAATAADLATQIRQAEQADRTRQAGQAARAPAGRGTHHG